MKINSFTLLTIFSIVYLVALIIIYFSKERLKTKETNIYKAILFTNLLGLIFQSLCRIVSDNYNSLNQIVVNFVLKNLLLYFIVFGALLLVYIVSISSKDSKKITKIIIIVYSLLGIITYFLPVSLFVDLENDIMYSYGVAVNYSYIIGGLTSLLIIIMLIREMKKVSRTKLLPLLLYLIFSGVAIIVQRLNPELMLICYVETFLCFVMYFTIENPDLKMLNELYKNRELMEAIYEDKYNFLFEMTQEARNPIKDINLLCSEIKKSNKLADVKENVDKLSTVSRQLDFSINNVLNISSMDIQKIKIVNTKYDVLKLCDGIGTAIKDDVPESVKLNIELPKQVPTLYGDYMKLRQILYSLLNNACKKTANGSITLKLNTIEKYDICRLIFNISDTGPGMSLDVINDILGSTGELNKEELKDLENKECNIVVCKKIARLMGGNLMIKSTIGQGTDVVLTLDQRVYHDDDTVLNQYKNELSNSKRALVVSQDKQLINSIKNRLSEKSVITSILYYGGDAVDKIRSGKKFDFILVDDEMNEMSGFDTFKAIKELDVKTPIIIMLKDDKERLKKHYLDDGFDNCLLISNLNSELNELVDKY